VIGVASRLLYVYAIVDAPIALADTAGFTQEPLMLVPGPGCWLAAGWIAAAPTPSGEALRAQDAVVRLLAARAEALLPLRFGTAFENETALQRRLERFNPDHVRAALSRVRGCEQMTLRAFHPASAPAPAPTPAITPGAASGGPGTAYLTQRAAALAIDLPALLQPLRAALAPLVRDELLDPAHRPPLIGAAYHLIARGDADRYRAIVAACALPPGITVRMSGPSPAYAFAQDALS